MAGLFRPIRKGAREKAFLLINKWKGWQLEFSCREALGLDDLDLLLGILAVCSREDRGSTVPVSPSSEKGSLARQTMAVSGCLMDRDFLSVETSWYELEKAAGKTPGHHPDAIRKCLRRLASVTLIVSRGSGPSLEEGSVHLLGYAIRAGRVLVTMNHRLSEAILGNQYTRLSLEEQRSLKGNRSEPARCLHMWLCAVIRPGRSRRFRLETLMAHAWPGEETIAETTLRKRRERLYGILSLLGSLEGWSVFQTREGMIEISRPGKSTHRTITTPPPDGHIHPT
jgi:hypothetical protein